MKKRADLGELLLAAFALLVLILLTILMPSGRFKHMIIGLVVLIGAIYRMFFWKKEKKDPKNDNKS